MTDQELNKKYSLICSGIAARRLKPVFDLLEKLITENGLGIYSDEYRSLKETYLYMLKYTFEGVFDPERQKVYMKLIISVFELADKVNEALKLKISASLEYEKKRMFLSGLRASQKEPEDFATSLRQIYDLNKLVYDTHTDNPETINAEADKNAKEILLKIRKLFYHIWFTDKVAPEVVNNLNYFFKSGFIPVPYRAFLITSLTLSLQHFFDPEKFSLLFDNYESEEAEISQRALVGLLINLNKYDSRLSFYPSITARLKILNENPAFKKNLERIIIQFIRSKETEKLQQRIRDEILPEMIKLSPGLKDKINLESLMEEGFMEDRNPDWEDILKDSPNLLKMMEEFSELQMKGSDVFMGSFSMLKIFPFFNELSNWFIPFFSKNPEIIEALDISTEPIFQLVETIEKAPILCNSDKYSFCFSIERLPKESAGFMTQAMQAEMEQLQELKEDEELIDPGYKSEFISNQYIQDIYRFYKLFPRKKDFEDIFNWPMDFHNNVALGDILKEDRKVLRNIAEYYFAKDYFKEAAGIFEYLLEKEKNGELYQKIAWCYQKTGNFEAALNAYLNAELYDINQSWNLKKIALIYRILKNSAKALEYYQAAEKLEPDNLSVQLNIGHCLLELDKYEEALKCYFKVEYLAPGNKNVWRPIAWCSFLTGKKNQAEKYYLKLMEAEPNKHDYVNMGHVQWSLGNRRAALDNYKKSISQNGFTEEEFLEVFEEDLPHLIKQGVDSEDVPIMLDQLRYFLEE